MQTKRGSGFEVCCNTGSGILVATSVWNWLLVPLLDGGFDYSSIQNNLMITMVFTTISVVRGYFWRRLFNWLEYKGVVN